MPTREQVQQLLDRGLDYEAAGRELGIPAPDQQTEQRGGLPASSQHLANPPPPQPGPRRIGAGVDEGASPGG